MALDNAPFAKEPSLRFKGRAGFDATSGVSSNGKKFRRAKTIALVLRVCRIYGGGEGIGFMIRVRKGAKSLAYSSRFDV